MWNILFRLLYSLENRKEYVISLQWNKDIEQKGLKLFFCIFQDNLSLFECHKMGSISFQERSVSIFLDTNSLYDQVCSREPQG